MNKSKNNMDSFDECLSVDVYGLMKILNAGRVSAEKIGKDAGAQFRVGRRVFYNVPKVKRYIDSISE